MKIILTGASRGIGKGIASVLSREGHQLGLFARSENTLRELKEELSENSSACTIACGDLRSWESTALAISKLIGELGGVDALINNAGLVLRKDIFSITLEDWQSLIETNVNGVFYTTKSVLPVMREQKQGHIINISSISGKLPLPGGSAYAASKFALTGFSQSLFQEVRDFGIKVSTVFPGSVDSASHRHGDSDSSWKVTPEEVGEACQSILCTSATNCISEVEIRPLQRPRG